MAVLVTSIELQNKREGSKAEKGVRNEQRGSLNDSQSGWEQEGGSIDLKGVGTKYVEVVG